MSCHVQGQHRPTKIILTERFSGSHIRAKVLFARSATQLRQSARETPEAFQRTVQLVVKWSI